MNVELRDDHIGIFDDCFGAKMCDDYIKYYKELESKGFIKNRQQERPEIDVKQINDSGIDDVVPPFHNFGDFNISYHAKEFNSIFWSTIYPQYTKKYSILNDYPSHNIYSIRLQRTLAGEGYHVWHAEDAGQQTKGRLLAYMLYLNDDFEGGETEFLYLKTRIKPRKNRLILWPAGFTHTHRGNMPLSGEKYVITGWVEY